MKKMPKIKRLWADPTIMMIIIVKHFVKKKIWFRFQVKNRYVFSSVFSTLIGISHMISKNVAKKRHGYYLRGIGSIKSIEWQINQFYSFFYLLMNISIHLSALFGIFEEFCSFKAHIRNLNNFQRKKTVSNGNWSYSNVESIWFNLIN